MKFIDEATIEVIAGSGGNGCTSFRREKYVPKGGPDGGNGGKGGDVIIRTEEGLNTLLDFRYNRIIKAGRGKHGQGKQKTGADGKNVIVKVPVGTLVYDADSGQLLCDLNKFPLEWVAAAGGRGGRGNTAFVSSTNRAPRKSEKGLPGERKRLRLELKLMADVGLVGLPNAGKSTLLAAVSNARPKIADYPFTTKVPQLGLIRIAPDKEFVMADIPGLIEGAHKGAGMGIKFLRHIERTKVILHLIDCTSDDPSKAYQQIQKELLAYGLDLSNRREIVCLTKADLINKGDFKMPKTLPRDTMLISAVTGMNIKSLLQRLHETLQGVA